MHVPWNGLKIVITPKGQVSSYKLTKFWGFFFFFSFFSFFHLDSCGCAGFDFTDGAFHLSIISGFSNSSAFTFVYITLWFYLFFNLDLNYAFLLCCPFVFSLSMQQKIKVCWMCLFSVCFSLFLLLLFFKYSPFVKYSPAARISNLSMSEILRKSHIFCNTDSTWWMIFATVCNGNPCCCCFQCDSLNWILRTKLLLNIWVTGSALKMAFIWGSVFVAHNTGLSKFVAHNIWFEWVCFT